MPMRDTLIFYIALHIFFFFADNTSRMTDVQSLKKGALIAATYDALLQVGPLQSCPF